MQQFPPPTSIWDAWPGFKFFFESLGALLLPLSPLILLAIVLYVAANRWRRQPPRGRSSVTVNLWKVREEALAALENDLSDFAVAIDEGFAIVDQIIVTFNQIEPETDFSFVCGLTMLKAKELMRGTLSLMLDGMAKESGALVRPLGEAREILTYIGTVPDRAKTVREKGPKLKAGDIAMANNSELKVARDYLHLHSAHFGFTPDSISRFIVPGRREWEIDPVFNSQTLASNLGQFLVQMGLVLLAATLCLKHAGPLAPAIVGQLTEFREKAIRLSD